jgi:hypothetical protein
MNNRITQFENTDAARAGDIYQNLAQHQRTENWRKRQLLAEFQTWAELNSVHFKLDVSEIALEL